MFSHKYQLYQLPLFEPSDVAIFLNNASKRFELSFIPTLLAPMYFYQAARLGWEQYRIFSNDASLRRAFNKIQKNSSKEKNLFLSTTTKAKTEKYILKKMHACIYLIQQDSL